MPREPRRKPAPSRSASNSSLYNPYPIDRSTTLTRSPESLNEPSLLRIPGGLSQAAAAQPVQEGPIGQPERTAESLRELRPACPANPQRKDRDQGERRAPHDHEAASCPKAADQQGRFGRCAGDPRGIQVAGRDRRARQKCGREGRRQHRPVGRPIRVKRPLRNGDDLSRFRENAIRTQNPDKSQGPLLGKAAIPPCHPPNRSAATRPVPAIASPATARTRRSPIQARNTCARSVMEASADGFAISML